MQKWVLDEYFNGNIGLSVGINLQDLEFVSKKVKRLGFNSTRIDEMRYGYMHFEDSNGEFGMSKFRTGTGIVIQLCFANSGDVVYYKEEDLD